MSDSWLRSLLEHVMPKHEATLDVVLTVDEKAIDEHLKRQQRNREQAQRRLAIVDRKYSLYMQGRSK